MTNVRRFLFAVVVGLLTVSASGVWSVIVTEPCTGLEATGGDDGTCPPTCVTCGCCAQALEPVPLIQTSSADNPVSELAEALPQLIQTEPRDILHVPKLLS